ncbi:cyclic dehypoxanthinyl futalosine synthase [Thermogutta sp.]|uniref:cyclic dehypoxanthinyl futalosine synthase n=1 Tax=Thermogutta sp. TaxID=1962930 RepID=UPI0025ECBB42|nr:cyclic dehypoxanthinyl futalosine synthase [Thermogutta sp.]
MSRQTDGCGSSVDRILDRAVGGKRLSDEEALTLLEKGNLSQLGEAAWEVSRRLHPEPYRTYNIDRNINYTNVCVAGCRFCAFYRKPGDSEAYVIDYETLFRKIEETLALGGDQILLQGGLNPKLPLHWYEDLLRTIKAKYPQINIHGFSPPEIYFFARMSRLSLEEVLGRLKEAGLGSLPGGGAEILVDSVRKQLARAKVDTDGWLAVCRAWHRLGGRGTATMMFGHVESLADRITHFRRIRDLQDETGGFTAFICWTFQPKNTEMEHVPKHGAFDYLRTLAVARLYLDNIPNIQASWVTQGARIGQLSLWFGANDMGSLMIEENVVAAAGTHFRTSEQELRLLISQAGYVPRRRNVFYELLDE